MISIKRLFIATLVCTFFFISNIVAQKVNQFDADGKRTGVWKKKYPNGKLRYTGSFLNGKEIGTFKFYENNSNNFPHITKEYKATSDTATVKFFNKDGDVKTIGKMIGKNRVGAWTYYFSNKNIFSEEFYNNGKLEGVLKNYYANGQVTEIAEYKNGLKNGVSKIYTENGVLIEEVIYVDGKLNGPAKYYDLKGQIKETGVYKDNKKDGKWEFYIDGQVSDKPKRQTHRVDKSN